jgi:hypothetical protein
MLDRVKRDAGASIRGWAEQRGWRRPRLALLSTTVASGDYRGVPVTWRQDDDDHDRNWLCVRVGPLGRWAEPYGMLATIRPTLLRRAPRQLAQLEAVGEGATVLARPSELQMLVTGEAIAAHGVEAIVAALHELAVAVRALGHEIDEAHPPSRWSRAAGPLMIGVVAVLAGGSALAAYATHRRSSERSDVTAPEPAPVATPAPTPTPAVPTAAPAVVDAAPSEGERRRETLREQQRFTAAPAARAGTHITVELAEPLYAAPNERFWITVVHRGAADTEWGAWTYVPEGVRRMHVKAPVPGDYELRLHARYPRHVTNVVHRALLRVDP